MSNEAWEKVRPDVVDELPTETSYNDETEEVAFSGEVHNGIEEDAVRALADAKDLPGIDEISVAGDTLEEYGSYFLDRGVYVWVGFEEVEWALAAIGAERLRVARENQVPLVPAKPVHIRRPDCDNYCDEHVMDGRTGRASHWCCACEKAEETPAPLPNEPLPLEVRK